MNDPAVNPAKAVTRSPAESYAPNDSRRSYCKMNAMQGMNRRTYNRHRMAAVLAARPLMPKSGRQSPGSPTILMATVTG
jgi:hypothetical protein